MNIKEIHRKYLQMKSLEKTVAWLREEHNYKINRQRLSRMFKEHGLEVQSPTGWGLQPHWQDPNKHLDDIGRFAADMIQLAFEDLDAGEFRMDRMSAAYFLSSELYASCLNLLTRRVPTTDIDHETLPVGMNVNEIIALRETYERNRAFWIPQ